MSRIVDIIAEMEKMKEPVIDFCIVELASGRMTILQIRELLHPIEIDDKMLHSDKSWGRNVITHDLPTSFIFPGLEKKDAQRMIYSQILKSLTNKMK